MSNVMLRLKGREIYKRIYAQHIEEVQNLLHGEKFMDAVYGLVDDPYKYTIPFLWGILQGKDGGKTVSDAQDLYNDLIDEGYDPDKLLDLVIDICSHSGFFTAAQRKTAQTLSKGISEMMKMAAEKMEAQMNEMNEPKPSESESSTAPVLALG